MVRTQRISTWLETRWYSPPGPGLPTLLVARLPSGLNPDVRYQMWVAKDDSDRLYLEDCLQQFASVEIADGKHSISFAGTFERRASRRSKRVDRKLDATYAQLDERIGSWTLERSMADVARARAAHPQLDALASIALGGSL